MNMNSNESTNLPRSILLLCRTRRSKNILNSPSNAFKWAFFSVKSFLEIQIYAISNRDQFRNRNPPELYRGSEITERGSKVEMNEICNIKAIKAANYERDFGTTRIKKLSTWANNRRWDWICFQPALGCMKNNFSLFRRKWEKNCTFCTNKCWIISQLFSSLWSNSWKNKFNWGGKV